MTTLYRFAVTRWPSRDATFSESYVARILVKLSQIWVSCYNWKNNRSTRVLFVQHSREQGEWLRYARVLTASFALLLGCRTNNTLAARSLSPKHTISIGRGIYMSSFSTYVTHNRKAYFPITHYAPKKINAVSIMQFPNAHFFVIIKSTSAGIKIETLSKFQII